MLGTRSPMSRIALASAAVLAALAGCASAPHPGAALDEIQVESRGQDGGGDACAAFALTPAQARYFLARALVVSDSQLRAGWDMQPCWVRGSARSSAGVWRWEIRAGGTASLETPAGATELRACDDCSAVLGRAAGKMRKP